MPKMLIDGAIEYEDGTPATEAQVGFNFSVSFILPLWSKTLQCIASFFGVYGSCFGIVIMQMGKDVVTFLSWAAEPEMEERKLVCIITTNNSLNDQLLLNEPSSDICVI